MRGKYEAGFEPPKSEVLSIGSIVGGTTSANRIWRESLGLLTHKVINARRTVESPILLNVIFQVPGDILKPEFEGVRTGHYAKEAKALIVQAALPEKVPVDPEAHLIGLLQDAVLAAEQWAQKRRIASDLHVLRDLVASL